MNEKMTACDEAFFEARDNLPGPALFDALTIWRKAWDAAMRHADNQGRDVLDLNELPLHQEFTAPTMAQAVENVRVLTEVMINR